MLLVALDETGGLRWWQLLLDPRLVRSETVAEDGTLRSESYYQTQVDFTVDFPDDAAIKELRFYHPEWTGRDFRLELLGNLPLR